MFAKILKNNRFHAFLVFIALLAPGVLLSSITGSTSPIKYFSFFSHDIWLATGTLAVALATTILAKASSSDLYIKEVKVYEDGLEKLSNNTKNILFDEFPEAKDSDSDSLRENFLPNRNNDVVSIKMSLCKIAEKLVQNIIENSALNKSSPLLHSFIINNSKQNMTIFILSIGTSLAGFLLLGIWVCQAIIGNRADIKSASLGVFLQFISATFMVVYKMTMRRTTDFAKQLSDINSTSSQRIERALYLEAGVRFSAACNADDELTNHVTRLLDTCLRDYNK